MTELASEHRNQHERIKKNIENAYNYFEDNYKRYIDFRNFVYVSTLSETDRAYLNELQKPKVEFNILEAYINRLLGEHAKNSPSIKVSGKDGRDIDSKLIDAIEGHMRYVIEESKKNGLDYDCMKDTLSGGFSGMKVYTEYAGEMSFVQDIFLSRVFDPTLTGFDPMAIKEDKSDGNFCFEIFPMRAEDLQREYPNLDLTKIKYRRTLGTNKSIGQFTWSFKNANREEFLLVGDYYEKKRKKEKIVMTTTYDVMTKREYDEMVDEWNQNQIAQPPGIIGKPRNTTVTKIVRYKIIEDQIIGYDETDFKRLPIVFCDGNSVTTKESSFSTVRQVTRPYIYQARGAQKFKNLAGITLLNDIENLGPSKMIASKDSIPPQYLEAYTNPQKANVYIYNAFKDNDPNIPLAPPQSMERPSIPAEVTSAFVSSDALIQNVLGSFDGSLARLTENEVSGKAIIESSTLGNAAAMPYVVSFMRALQSAAQIILEMIPLYYTTPRTIPVMDEMGQKSFIYINDPDDKKAIDFNYDYDDLQISVEAGASFSSQQTKALQQITALMNASPTTAQFIEEEGLDILFNNMDFRNVDELRERLIPWLEQRKAQQQAILEAQANQPNPEAMAMEVYNKEVETKYAAAMQKLQVEAATEQAKLAMKQSEVDIKRAESETDILKVLADIQIEMAKLRQNQEKIESDMVNKAAERALEATKLANEHADKQLQAAADVMEAASQLNPNNGM